MTAFVTVDPACWAFAFHPSLADAEAAADAKDHLVVQSPGCLSGLTAAEGVALFAATAAPLGIAPVKRFASRDVAARRIWENLLALAAVPETAAEPAPQPAVQPKAKAQPSAQKTPRGINLAPKAEARACRAGTKQAILVDMLSRPGGASMAELRAVLAPWKDVTIKSGLSWDMGHQKGYGIRTTHENGYQRWLATDYEGMGTFRADSHPDDLTEADKAALLADNLASGYNPAQVFAVYHLVLPEGLTAPIPHTGKPSIVDKMNGFVPGMVEGQEKFYHVAEDGAVTRHWIVPGSYGPTSYGPAADHPCGDGPRPGWYDSNARPLPCDPREAAQ